VTAFLAEATARIGAWVDRLGLGVSWQPATDPFFDPRHNAKYVYQKLEPVKQELVFDGRLAIGSTNFHRSYFGRRSRSALAEHPPTRAAWPSGSSAGSPRSSSASGRAQRSGPSSSRSMADAILVTGATGHLGQRLIGHCSSAPPGPVVAWLHAADEAEFEVKRARFPPASRLRFAWGDLRAADPFARVDPCEPATILHAAASPASTWSAISPKL
jgi:hypothetical protein